MMDDTRARELMLVNLFAVFNERDAELRLKAIADNYMAKEAVDGSSPSEGFAKAPLAGFSVGLICTSSNGKQAWSRYGGLRSKTPSANGTDTGRLTRVPEVR
jgi:hypothetical protein